MNTQWEQLFGSKVSPKKHAFVYAIKDILMSLKLNLDLRGKISILSMQEVILSNKNIPRLQLFV